MKLNKNQRNIFFTLGFFSIVFLMFIRELRYENQLLSNKKTTIGKITGIKSASKSRKYLEYSFYADGIKINESDPLHATWPKHIREGRIVVNGYYLVEYDSLNPKNAKLAIQKSPYTLKQLLNKGMQVDAKIEKAMEVSKAYVDLRISYGYKNEAFNFRTRLQKDSLPCGNLGSCQNAIIKLVINKHYPEVNDLYFKSHDRKHILNKYGLR